MMAVFVAVLGVGNQREVDAEPHPAAERELPDKADAQRSPDELVADDIGAAVDVAADEAQVVAGTRSVDFLGPLAVAGKDAEVGRSLLQHPLVTNVQHAVGKPAAAHRRGDVRELLLPGPEILVVERTGIDAAHANESLQEPIAGEGLTAEELERIGVEVLVQQDRSRIAERGRDALRVVRVLGLAGAQPVAHAQRAARVRRRRILGERTAGDQQRADQDSNSHPSSRRVCSYLARLLSPLPMSLKVRVSISYFSCASW